MKRRVGPVGGIGKRSFDCAAALAALVILSPIMLMIALLILKTIGRPVFFAQRSFGFNSSLFTRVTFRTAIFAAHEIPRAIADHAHANASRGTWLGNILREKGLDELPQLLNILCGHMSFIGPQCLPASQLATYSGDLKHYAKARPGLASLWQSGRSKNSKRSHRVSSDRYYVQRWSPALDLFILTRTVIGFRGLRDTASNQRLAPAKNFQK